MKPEDRKKRLVKTAKEYAKVHLKDPIVNKQTGWPIEVSAGNIEHTLGYDFGKKKGRFTDIYSLVRHLKTILKNCEYKSSEPDKNNSPDIKAIHKFQMDVLIKGETEIIEIVVKEVIMNKRKMIDKFMYYNHKFIIEEIKNLD